MKFNFDYEGLLKYPIVKLCKPNKKPIAFLTMQDLVISPTFCDTSEMTFKIYDNNVNYDKVKKYMTLDVDGFGFFEIRRANENSDGTYFYKEVTAYSYEITLSNVYLTFDETVFRLYEPSISPTRDETLLGLISKYTGWSIGNFHTTLYNRYRTMNVDDKSAYELLSEISEAFNCYFTFDTVNHRINCYDKSSTQSISKVNLSFKNLIQSMEVSDVDEDIVTALTVKGAEDVGISLVNPLGNDVIYDFSYFTNDTECGMSDELRETVLIWQQSISDNMQQYKDLVTLRRNSSARLIALDGELSILNTELKSLKDLQSVAIASGNEERLSELYPLVQQKETEISNMKIIIGAEEDEYRTYVEGINNIVSSLSFENNFTEEQRVELQYYIKTGKYENTNFVFTDIMNEYQKIDIEDQLMQQAEKIFENIKNPKFDFNIKVSNFFLSQKYKAFTDELQLGGIINVERKPNVWIQPRVLRFNIHYDDIENTTMELSESYILNNGTYRFIDDFRNNVSNAVSKVSASASLWDTPHKDGTIVKMNEFINSSLDLGKNEIISAKNQDFSIGEYGIRGRKVLDSEAGSYSPKQLAITNNVIALTDDNWEHCKVAIGEVIQDNGAVQYGIAADVLVGRLICGEQLVISSGSENSENELYHFGAGGASFRNATLNINNSQTKIVISPDEGIKIVQVDGNTEKKVFYTDTTGQVVADGIKLKSSNVGGWITTEDGIYAPNYDFDNNTGDCIKCDGTGKLSLFSWSTGQANFDGNIYANNLIWTNRDNSTAYVFSMDDGDGTGHMGGGWLTNGTVSYEKVDQAFVGKLVADEVFTNALFANSAFIDNLSANAITANSLATNYLLSNTGVFSGKVRVGTDESVAELKAATVTMDNVTAPRFYMSGTNGIELSGNYGGITLDAGHNALGGENSVSMNKATIKNGITVNGDAGFTGTINGIRFVYGIAVGSA